MKLAIITFCADHTSYGSALQAYALQTVLTEQGHTVDLIRYRELQPPRRLTPAELCRRLAARFGHRRLRRAVHARTRTFARFNAGLHITKVYEGEEALLRDLPAYDGYICGSDQIWNISRTGGKVSRPYYLSFAPEGVPKVAYAASAGDYMPTEAEFVEITALTCALTAVSVREPAMAEELAARGVEAQVCADPVFLLSPTKWLEHTASVVVPDIPYGVCHFSEKDPLARKTVQDLMRTYGVPIFNVSEGGTTFRGTERRYENCDPLTFLKLIANSSFCVGDTYRLTTLACLFQKPMLLLQHERNTHRVRPLVERFGREECFVTRGELNEQVVKLMQQHPAARGLSAWSTDSRDWLFDALAKKRDPAETEASQTTLANELQFK